MTSIKFIRANWRFVLVTIGIFSITLGLSVYGLVQMAHLKYPYYSTHRGTIFACEPQPMCSFVSNDKLKACPVVLASNCSVSMSCVTYTNDGECRETMKYGTELDGGLIVVVFIIFILNTCVVIFCTEKWSEKWREYTFEATTMEQQPLDATTSTSVNSSKI